MGLLGSEIVQSRTWIEDPPPPLPSLNYKYTFPITVFDAVRKSMQDENSETLTEVLDRIFKELARKQPMIPGRPANYLVTYAGSPGALGAIQMSYEIPWNPANQSNSKIPTEKAVGDLFRKLGLLDEEGEVIKPEDRIVRWSDIIGRPNIYEVTGNNDDGVMTQRAITEALADLESRFSYAEDDKIKDIIISINQMKEHITNNTNPHNVTLEQIGAASKESLEAHLTDYDNPHQVTKEQLGLENVDNTSDIDKPISTATQEAIDRLTQLIKQVESEIPGEPGQTVTNITYDQNSGDLTILYQDGSSITLHIPINGLVDDIMYDELTKDLIIVELGAQHRCSLLDLFHVYIGSEGTQVNISVTEGEGIAPGVISATITPKSITSAQIEDGAISTDLIANLAVTTEKIREKSITTGKIETAAVTSEKIANYSVTDKKLADRSVTPRTLFTADEDESVLMVMKAGSDPVWGKIPAAVIAENSITNNNIVNNTITGDKIVHETITTNHIQNFSITNVKLAIDSVVTQNIVNNTITGPKLEYNIILPGTPEVEVPPADDSDNNQVPNTNWVRNIIQNYKFGTDNLEDRAVTPDKMFTTDERNRVLAVFNAGTNPVWGTINHEMLDEGIIDTANIVDYSVTREKIYPRSISDKEIDDNAILARHISEGVIDGSKLAVSPVANRVLGVTNAGDHPIYTQITSDMIQSSAIGTAQIKEGSVTLSKLEPSDRHNRVLVTTLKNSTPTWGQVTNPMLASRSVDTRVLASSEVGNSVLAVQKAGDDPLFTKIRSDMIFPGEVKQVNIAEGAIAHTHLQDKIVESNNIMDWAIQSKHISPRSITGIELFTSPVPNRVLAVTSMPYSNADWLQVTTDMIEDCAITNEKLFQSNHDYRVLGVTEKGRPPEYLRITGDFVVNDSITPDKLKTDFVLHGTPKLTTEPDASSDSMELANTHWVRQTLKDMGLSGDIGIGPGGITGDKFWKPEDGVGVLGVRIEGETLDYIMVDSRVIANGGINYTKLERDILLLGSPTLDIRPPADACDENGTGTLIPDCQWVMDRINELTGPTYWYEITHIALEDEWDAKGVGDTTTEDNYEITKERVDREWAEEGQGDLTPDNQYEINDDRVKEEWANNGEGDIEIPEDAEYDPPGFLDPWEIEAIKNGMGGKFSGGGSNWGSGSGSKPSTGGSGSGSGSTSGGSSGGTGETVGAALTTNSVATDHIRRRAVTGEKMFTTAAGDAVLAVLDPNSDPQYTKITSQLIEPHSINGRSLFTSPEANTILAVRAPNGSAEWTRINHDMLDDGVITTLKIHDLSVTTEKLADQSVDITKIKREPFIDSYLLIDGAVTGDKIAKGSIDAEHLAPGTISAASLGDNIELTGHPTVKGGNAYEVRSIRNIIVSNNRPSNTRLKDGCRNGDIWFQYM